MPRTNDYREKLVAAVLDREKLRQLALADSRESSFRSSISSYGSSSSSWFDIEDFNSLLEVESVPIHEVAVLSFEELKEKTDNFGPTTLIGEGAYGRVYFAKLKIGDVAVKKLDVSSSNIEFLTQLLHINEQTLEVCREACITLVEFVKISSLVHCKEIIIANGAKHLVQLVEHSEDEIVQIQAISLLCYLARHAPESKELADAEVLPILKWASQHKHFVEDGSDNYILQEALEKFNKISDIINYLIRKRSTEPDLVNKVPI